jgi:hypothetical protein
MYVCMYVCIFIFMHFVYVHFVNWIHLSLSLFGDLGNNGLSKLVLRCSQIIRYLWKNMSNVGGIWICIFVATTNNNNNPYMPNGNVRLLLDGWIYILPLICILVCGNCMNSIGIVGSPKYSFEWGRRMRQ